MQKYQTRHGVFETNSSSTHSLVLDNDLGVEKLATLPDNLLHSDGTIVLSPEEFGWEYSVYTDALMKANYVLTYLLEKIPPTFTWGKDTYTAREILKVTQQFTDFTTGFADLLETILWKYPEKSFDDIFVQDPADGNIDYQSIDLLRGEITTLGQLRNFIFNPKCHLITANDNH